jgi:predicted ArsR family transcriptional regulator
LSSEISKKFDTFSSFFCILSDKRDMEGMTVSEIAQELKISVDAVRKRIETAGVQPITREAVYDPKVLEILRSVRMGRPPKARAEAKKKPKK